MLWESNVIDGKEDEGESQNRMSEVFERPITGIDVFGLASDCVLPFPFKTWSEQICRYAHFIAMFFRAQSQWNHMWPVATNQSTVSNVVCLNSSIANASSCWKLGIGI